jgi:1,4-dihydroxy-2-naphthoate octaprenyltransferase
MGRAYQQSVRRFGRITVGTLLSGLVEGVIAMAALTYVGLFNVRPELLAVIWAGAIAANMVLSTVGAQLTVLLLRRYRK